MRSARFMGVDPGLEIGGLTGKTGSHATRRRRATICGAHAEGVTDGVGQLGAIERVEVKFRHALTFEFLHLLDGDSSGNQAARFSILIQAIETMSSASRARLRRRFAPCAAAAGSA